MDDDDDDVFGLTELTGFGPWPMQTRRTTWHSPGCITSYRILAPRRSKSSINEAKSRTIHGADINSGHDLVVMTTKLKLKKN